MLKRLENFFHNFCKDVLSENIVEANWNYDELFLTKFKEYVNDISNLLGL